MEGVSGIYGDRRGARRVLLGRTDEKRPLGTPRRKWKNGDNIAMALQESGWGDKDWIDLAQGSDRLRTFVNSVINIRFS